MALVVYGATGFLGRHVVATAVELGWNVRAVARLVPRRSEAGAVEWVDLNSISANRFEGSIREGDVIVNLAFGKTGQENLDLLDGLLKASAMKRASCFIHCSTATVVGATESLIVTEETPCLPRDSYERLKMAMEQRVFAARRAGLRTIIVRPTAVIGPEGRNLQKLAVSLMSENAVWNCARTTLFGDRPMHLVPVATVASAILHLVMRQGDLDDDVYIVAADDDPENRFPAVERILTAALRLPPRKTNPRPLPRQLLSFLLRLRGRSDPALERSYSSERLRSTGFVPTVTVGEAVAEFGNWFRESQNSFQ